MVFAFPAFLLTPSARGVFWKFFSTLCFVIATTLVFRLGKVGSTLSPFQIAFFQAAIPWIILRLIPSSSRADGLLAIASFKNSLLTSDFRNALLRALCACIGFGAWFWSLKLLPLSLVGFFRLLGPLVTFGAALLFLKERTSSLSLMALCGTLIGAALLMSDELMGGSWHLTEHVTLLHFILPFLAILGFAGANIFGKKLLKTVPPRQATLSLLALSSIFLSFFALPVWIWPSAQQWGLLILIGGLDAAAQGSLSRALSLTRLSLLVPIGLWRFALLALSGMIFFSEPFRPILWIGVLLIAVMTGIIVRKG